MIQRLVDLLLEIRIWMAMENALELQREGLLEAARIEWRFHAGLVARRSPKQVQRMSQEQD